MGSHKSKAGVWAVSQGKAIPEAWMGTASGSVRPALPWGAGMKTCVVQLSALPGGGLFILLYSENEDLIHANWLE